MAVINKPAQPLIAPTDVEEVEAIAGAAAADAIASDTTHAPLVNDLVPAANLPSYVDDVLEFKTLDSFPAEGEIGKIYVALDTNNTYRWADTTYVQVGGSESGSATQHYLYLDVTVHKPSGPIVIIGSELQVTYFECDDCDSNVWFPYDIGTAPVVTSIHLILSDDAEMQFNTLFYPAGSNDLYDISEHRHINYNSENGIISINLDGGIYQYRDSHDQLVYGDRGARILVTPNQETDAYAYLSAMEHVTNSQILANQFGILPAQFIYDGVSYAHMGCKGRDLSDFDPKSGRVLDLITGESSTLSGIHPTLYLDDDGKFYWIRPIDEHLIDDANWHTGVWEELEYCYRIYSSNDTNLIDFYYNSNPNVTLNLILNSDDDGYSLANYPIIHQLTFAVPVMCGVTIFDSSQQPLIHDLGQLGVTQDSTESGIELNWIFGGTNGIMRGRYWIDAETGDLRHEINWDSYSLPTAGGDTEVYIPVTYNIRPAPEEEPLNFPPSEWPTKLSLDEIRQGTINFGQLIGDSLNVWGVINVVGYCECIDGYVFDAWGPITVNVYKDQFERE